MIENYPHPDPLKERFGGYLPIVIDIETGGLEPLKNPILEIAAVLIEINQEKNYILKNYLPVMYCPSKVLL